MPKTLSVAAAATTALLLAAGCGSDDDENATATAASAGPALEVVETDFAIEPAQAKVDKAGIVRIEVVNRGQAPHALAIETPDGTVRSDQLAAGDSGRLEAELADGTYTWYCPVGDHRARGMEGEVTVGKGGSTSTGREAPSGGYGY
jgi:uncharacterized cupredoxin-like copper-binding protein